MDTKVEGNPDHPASLGSTCVHSQASVLDLYDPGRAREITHLTQPQTWEQFLEAMNAAFRAVVGTYQPVKQHSAE